MERLLGTGVCGTEFTCRLEGGRRASVIDLVIKPSGGLI